MILSRPRNNLESKKVNIPELDSQVAGLRVWHPEEKRRDLIKKKKRGGKLDVRVK
jgi:hypothetical protein